MTNLHLLLFLGVIPPLAASLGKEFREKDSESDWWRFEKAYPRQLVALRAPPNGIRIDGKLDADEWGAFEEEEFNFQDIAQPIHPDTRIPSEFQTAVKVRFDEEYFYVGAVLREPFIWGSIVGHNENLTGHRAPYFNTDFEAFFDVSGTGHFYKEFEMNVRNATYDILWRVADGGFTSIGVPCDNGDARWCQNSTYNRNSGMPGEQSWTMKGGSTGLKTATYYGGYANEAYCPFTRSSATKYWSVEAAFPLKSRPGKHGGLLDGGDGLDFSRFDPNVNDGVFWFVDFARTQHPLLTIGSDAPSQVSNFGSAEYDEMCAKLQKEHPTLLGTDEWSCYWSWVLQPLRGTHYLHNPALWAMVEFQSSKKGDGLTYNPQWPVRYILQMYLQAQIRYSLAHRGVYAKNMSQVLSNKFCNVSSACNLADLSRIASSDDGIFRVSTRIDESGSCVDYISAKPYGASCLNISVTFRPPTDSGEIIGYITGDRFMFVK